MDQARRRRKLDVKKVKRLDLRVLYFRRRLQKSGPGTQQHALQRVSLYKITTDKKTDFSFSDYHLLFVETPKAFWLKKPDKTTNNALF